MNVLNVGIGTEAAQFLFREYINSNFYAVRVLEALTISSQYLTSEHVPTVITQLPRTILCFGFSQAQELYIHLVQ